MSATSSTCDIASLITPEWPRSIWRLVRSGFLSGPCRSGEAWSPSGIVQCGISGAADSSPCWVSVRSRRDRWATCGGASDGFRFGSARYNLNVVARVVRDVGTGVVLAWPTGQPCNWLFAVMLALSIGLTTDVVGQPQAGANEASAAIRMDDDF